MKAVLNRVHLPRPDWYEELYAVAMAASMKSYEDEIAGYKSELFANLTTGKAEKILEIGIGTGPNLKYYGNLASSASVAGVDPNRKMEKCAQAAAKLLVCLQQNSSSFMPYVVLLIIFTYFKINDLLPSA
ncbi:putative S-adenosyl-L-methionine-dependent methyltransferase [Helianthus anomalus]